MFRDDQGNLAIRTYGHRIHESQTLPEYLIEFALVFLSDRPKDADPTLGGPGEFPKRTVKDKELEYVATPRMGLKRFIFFERSKQEDRLDIDEVAYKEIREQIAKKVETYTSDITPSDVVDIIQELFYGYNAVLLNRSWFAQSLLPICPELVFPDAMRRGVKRNSASKRDIREIQISGNREVDHNFEFFGYYFQARGGEVYYLHVLQGLEQEPTLRSNIEQGLNELFNSRPELASLATWTQGVWEQYTGIMQDSITKTCRWIPKAYEMRAKYTCRELSNFLTARMDPLRKIQLLSVGIILQILRMMHDRAGLLKNEAGPRPAWIFNIPGCKNPDVRGLAARSYQQCEDDLLEALYKSLPPGSDRSSQEIHKMISDGAKNAHRLFRKLGKSAELVVPPVGKDMRFSLSENILKFLVMALIHPGEKVLLSDFMSDLYEHFGIIIGSIELVKYRQTSNLRRHISDDISLLRENENAFKEMLKACGFLRDLSDATAIVENPFGG